MLSVVRSLLKMRFGCVFTTVIYTIYNKVNHIKRKYNFIKDSSDTAKCNGCTKIIWKNTYTSPRYNGGIIFALLYFLLVSSHRKQSNRTAHTDPRVYRVPLRTKTYSMMRFAPKFLSLGCQHLHH